MMRHSEVNSSAMPSSNDRQNNKNNHGDPQTDTNTNGHNQSSSQAFPNLGRQSSIYSLTLDEFQHTLCENGKNFGSMNMDEFLSSIWSAEENQAHHGSNPHHNNSTAMPTASSSAGLIAKQPSLPRQGSLTLPAPLCRKTVDEVWTEIHRTHQQEALPAQQHAPNENDNENPNSTQRQPTFGEMTLEDFLVKAGVVREHCGSGQPVIQQPLAVVPPAPPAQQIRNPYAFTGPSFVAQPMNNGYPVAPSVACYGGRVTNGGAPAGGFGTGLSPVRPVSPDGLCGMGQVDNPAAQYGLDMAALRGRKRIIDGPVEKVVERRQRRMIKNRESAARSRARKQAYTVELEAELNQLREENTQLKQALAEMERQRKQQCREEEQQQVAGSRGESALQQWKSVRRSGSCNL